VFSLESVVRENKQPVSIAHLCRQTSSLFSFSEYCACACWKIRDNKYILSVKRFSGNWVNNILSPSADCLCNKHKNWSGLQIAIWVTPLILSLLGSYSYFIQSHTEKLGLRDETPDLFRELSGSNLGRNAFYIVGGFSWFYSVRPGECRDNTLAYTMAVSLYILSNS
jgi:hypothetical protein